MLAKQDSGHLALSGRLSIATVSATHAHLQEAVAEHRQLILDISDVEEVDLSFVQVVESARKSATRMGGGVSLARPAEGALRTALVTGGFLAGHDDERSVFWIGHEAVR
jgi:anti-anti-sigma regulatory factor